MKLNGYTKSAPDTARHLSELVIQADPDNLDKLAEFFKQCSQSIRATKHWDHEHISDSEFKLNPNVEVIICKGKGESPYIFCNGAGYYFLYFFHLRWVFRHVFAVYDLVWLAQIKKMPNPFQG